MKWRLPGNQIPRHPQGKRGNLFFYRESNGNEVDLLAESGRSLIALEIKAGASINPDYFKGQRHFSRAVGATRQVTGGVIYGGSEIQKRSDFPVYPVMLCEEFFAQLAQEVDDAEHC